MSRSLVFISFPHYLHFISKGEGRVRGVSKKEEDGEEEEEEALVLLLEEEEGRNSILEQDIWKECRNLANPMLSNSKGGGGDGEGGKKGTFCIVPLPFLWFTVQPRVRSIGTQLKYKNVPPNQWGCAQLALINKISILIPFAQLEIY